MQGEDKGLGRMSGYAGSLPECELIHWRHPITPPSRCAAGGRSSRSSWEGLSMGRH